MMNIAVFSITIFAAAHQLGTELQVAVKSKILLKQYQSL
jgi:hypothetical protein